MPIVEYFLARPADGIWAAMDHIRARLRPLIGKHIFSHGAQLVVDYATMVTDVCYIEPLGAYLVNDRGYWVLLPNHWAVPVVEPSRNGHFGFACGSNENVQYWTIAKPSKSAAKVCGNCGDKSIGAIMVETFHRSVIFGFCVVCWRDLGALAWIGVLVPTDSEAYSRTLPPADSDEVARDRLARVRQKLLRVKYIGCPAAEWSAERSMWQHNMWMRFAECTCYVSETAPKVAKKYAKARGAT